MTSQTPSHGAERVRRHRERRRAALSLMAGDVPADLVSALVKNNWLGSDEAKDPRKLGATLIDLADCWLRGTLGSPKT